MEYLILKSAHETFAYTHIFGYVRDTLIQELKLLDEDLDVEHDNRNGQKYRSTISLIELMDFFLRSDYDVVSIATSLQEISYYNTQIVSVVTLIRKVSWPCPKIKKTFSQEDLEEFEQEEPTAKQSENSEEEDETDEEEETEEDEESEEDTPRNSKGILAGTNAQESAEKQKKNVSFKEEVKVVDF